MVSRALLGGGCSVSYQLDAVLANKDAGAPDQGDSPRAAEPKAMAEMPAEADLAIARAAPSAARGSAQFAALEPYLARSMVPPARRRPSRHSSSQESSTQAYGIHALGMRVDSSCYAGAVQHPERDPSERTRATP